MRTNNPYHRIDGMWPREYQFFCHMKAQGVPLNYLSQSVKGMFRLHRGCYTPDFHDEATGMFYEVVGTRQAFRKGIIKYREFKAKYPEVPIRFVSPSGEEILLTNKLRW